jgi:hypothetical protein
MEITVNVDSIDLGDYIDTHLDEDGDRVPGGTLGDAVVRQLVNTFSRSDTYRGLAERVRTIRDEEIRAAIAPAIAEAVSAPIQSTNRYGEKTGEQTTLRELIADEARRYLTQPADNNYRNQGTRLQIAVREAVDGAFSEEIAAEVKQARDAVTTQLGTTVAVLVTDAVKQALAKR